MRLLVSRSGVPASSTESALVSRDEPRPPPPGQMVRVCVLCGKTEEETRIARGPDKIPFAGICESCTRIACGELGIALPDEPTDTDKPSPP